MEFKIGQQIHSCRYDGLWYIGGGNWKYLWKDLEIHNGTYNRLCGRPTREDAPGYYATKAEAERYLKAYEVKQMVWLIKQSQTHSGKWYIVAENVDYYKTTFFPCLHKNLEIHPGTAYCNPHYDKDAGFYNSAAEAKQTLKLYKEKHNMAEDKLVINVKVNGVDTPLHEISEETLLRIREASKPKPVPVFRVCSMCDTPRLILKITDSMVKHAGEYVALDKHGDIRGTSLDQYGAVTAIAKGRSIYTNIRELRLDEV